MPKKKTGELTVVHTFAIKPSQLKEIRQAAFDRDMSISKYICNALRYYQTGLILLTDAANLSFVLGTLKYMPRYPLDDVRVGDFVLYASDAPLEADVTHAALVQGVQRVGDNFRQQIISR